MSNLQLKDKVAIVTGGAGGIGTAIAMAYAQAGAKVVVASRKKENLDIVAAKIKAQGRESLAIATDVCVQDQVDNMVKETVSVFGRIDILVNNAGGALHFKPTEDLTPEEWNAGIMLNLTSPFLCSLAVGKVMIEQKSGKIINISSVAGLKGVPRMAHYGAAKAGLNNLTKTLAAGWGKYNIHVNCIAPGLTATEGIKSIGMLPPDKNKDGTPIPPLEFPSGPEHVANLAVYLGSDASAHLTGEIIPFRSLVAFDR